MGGNALKEHGTVRLAAPAFKSISQRCVNQLKQLYPNRRIVALGSYQDKADFGDCDILIESAGEYSAAQAAAAIGALEVVRNGPVTSVGVALTGVDSNAAQEVFQVDLIETPSEAFNFALNYFGHGDTGNLLGRIAHAMGLALRHDGLFYYYRDGDYKFREILLSREFEDALELMGYPRNSLQGQFASAQAVYEFVASSPYFNADIFLLENRNAKSRVRDRKRAMYMEFLKWCENTQGLTRFEYPTDKRQWFSRIEAFFPEFKAQYTQCETDLAQLRLAKEKFNGQLVSELTGLQGKELGQLMKEIKETFSSPQAQLSFVLESSPEQIQSKVLAVFSTFVART